MADNMGQKRIRIRIAKEILIFDNMGLRF